MYMYLTSTVVTVINVLLDISHLRVIVHFRSHEHTRNLLILLILRTIYSTIMKSVNSLLNIKMIKTKMNNYADGQIYIIMKFFYAFKV